MPQTEEIYQKYANTVYKYLLSKTRNTDLAEELTQETFYRAIRASGSFDGTCTVSTWLCAIAKNLLREYWRKHPETEEISETDDSVQSSEDTVLASMERVHLLRKLHLLEEPWREILYLRIYGSLSFREIGDIFERNENWARVNYYRGKEKLRKEIENDSDTM